MEGSIRQHTSAYVSIRQGGRRKQELKELKELKQRRRRKRTGGVGS